MRNLCDARRRKTADDRLCDLRNVGARHADHPDRTAPWSAGDGGDGVGSQTGS
jgi:hypothetical protein